MLGALAVLAIAYRYYSAFIAARVLCLDDARGRPRRTPGTTVTNFHPTNRWVLFGHHFAAITGAGPLIGPVLAAQFGFYPGFSGSSSASSSAARCRTSSSSWPARGGRQIARRDRAGRARPDPRPRHRGRHPLHRGHRARRARPGGGRARSPRARGACSPSGCSIPIALAMGLYIYPVCEGLGARHPRGDDRWRASCSSPRSSAGKLVGDSSFAGHLRLSQPGR